MNEAQIFVLSEHALTKIVDQITGDQWQLEIPKEISAQGGTLKELINYHAADDSWVPDTLSGKTIAEVGTKYDGDLLGGNPKEAWHAIVEKSIAAAENADLEKTVHLTYGDYPAKVYLNHITLFRTCRTVDLARLLKFDDSLPEELVKGMWDYVRADAPMLRQIGILPAEVPVSEDAPLFERLMGFIGRQPKVH